jgi:ribosomal protein RSM22 (predicted rRNA methylase)
MLVELPRELRDALDRSLRNVSPQDLSRAAADLSSRYREEEFPGTPVARSATDVTAYAAYRLPATYAAIVSALRAVAEQRPGWSPRSLLDLGAGLGVGLWAATTVWPGVERLTAIDAQADMISAGRDLSHAGRHPVLQTATWRQSDLRTGDLPEPHDVVLLAYVLGEIEPGNVEDLLDRAWKSTGSAFVIVEPGTPDGYRRVLKAQEILRGRGGFTLAPCPHEPTSELAEGDWIHFSVRLPRSKVHRAAKGAELGYEDEKYAYAVMAREPVARTYSRILRHPQFRKGHVYLQLCTPDGIKTIVVSKRDRERYNRARKAAWGDVFEWSEG